MDVFRIDLALASLIGAGELERYKAWVCARHDASRDMTSVFNAHRAKLAGSFSLRDGVLGVLFGDTDGEAKDFWLSLDSFAGDWAAEWDPEDRLKVVDALEAFLQKARKGL